MYKNVIFEISWTKFTQEEMLLLFLVFGYIICDLFLGSNREICKFCREIGVPNREILSRQKYSILVSKIVICSTIGHCIKKNVLFASVWLTGGK